MAEERVRRRRAAILAADAVGYSRLVEADEAGIVARLNSYSSVNRWNTPWQPVRFSGIRSDNRNHQTGSAKWRARSIGIQAGVRRDVDLNGY